MKRLLLILLLLACTLPPPADGADLNGRTQLALSAAIQAVVGTTAAPACADSSCTEFLVCENFQTATTGYDSGLAWSETVGTNGVVEAADTTATVLRGTQQLKLYAGDAGQYSISRTTNAYASPATTYVHFRWKTPDTTPSSSDDFFYILDSSGNILCCLKLITTGTVRLYHGTAYQASAGTLSNDTLYHIWIEYTKGTGSDGVAKVWIGTTSTKPGSTFTTNVTNGTATADSGKLQLRAGYQQTYFYDQLLVNGSEIGDVCDP